MEVWIVVKMNSQAVMLGSLLCIYNCKAYLQGLMYFNVNYLLDVFVYAF